MIRFHLCYIGAILASVGATAYITLRPDETAFEGMYESIQESNAIDSAKRDTCLCPPNAWIGQNNRFVISEHLESTECIVHGWKSEKVGDDTYIVSCTWTERGTLKGVYFEVNQNVFTVRQILPNSTLANHYGLDVPPLPAALSHGPPQRIQ